MEHQLYYVKRRRTPKGFSLTLIEHPKIKAGGLTEEEAESSLLDLICAHFGDGEPVLQYEDAPSSASSSLSHLWMFSANEKLTTRNLLELFPKGKCSRCANVIGGLNRSIEVIRLLAEKSSSALAFTKSGNNTTQLLSDRLVEVLLGLGLDKNILAPAKDAVGNVFWEVLPTSNYIPFAPMRAAAAYRVGAMRCPKCFFETFGFVGIKDKNVREFVRETDWRDSKSPIRVAGPFAPKLIFTDKVKRKIEEVTRWKNLGWSKVGLAKEDEIDSKLKFNLYP